jgi:hypothetical protein
MEIPKPEQTKVVENSQASTVYGRAAKLLDLFGAEVSNRSRNEGDDRKRVFAVEISNNSDTPNKLGITSYVDNKSMMIYWEDKKGATRVVINQQLVLDTMTYTRNEEGLLRLNTEQKTKGKPKLKPIAQAIVFDEIKVALARAEDFRNNADKIKNEKLMQSKISPRRGLAVTRKAIAGAGQLINGIISR